MPPEPVVDFDQAAALASPDTLPELESNLKAAEIGLSKAAAESARLNRLRWEINGQISDLNAKIKATRVNAFKQIALERAKNAAPLFADANQMLSERNDLVAAFSYISSFAYDDAAIHEMECAIAEREASARLLEGQALDMRQRALQAAGNAAAIDNGLAMSFKDSRSQKLLERGQEIWREVQSLQDQLAATRLRVENEQNLAAPSLFNQ